MASGNIFVITGAPSSGKTTLVTELKRRGHFTISEAARALIEEETMRGKNITDIRSDEKVFQEKVVELKVKMEKVANSVSSAFLDRGMHDTLAYLEYYGFKIENWVQQLMRPNAYHKVFILQPLDKFEQDGIRVEGEDFAVKITDKLQEVYERYGMTPIMVPALGVNDRVNYVLRHTKGENT